MQREVLADNVVVYRNAIANKEKIIKALREFDKWEKWYDVGQQLSMPLYEPNLFFERYPNKEEWDNNSSLWRSSSFFQNNPGMYEALHWRELEEAFYETTTDYLSLFPVDSVSDWCVAGANILRYDAKKEGEVTKEASGTLNYALPFHTDYHYETEDQPGFKPTITVTFYFNDDYEGGDIEYRVFDRHFTSFRIEGENMIDLDNNEAIVPGFNYKPQAGDIIIFPSRRPYYHGVKKVTAGQKLFLRTFWMHNKK